MDFYDFLELNEQEKAYIVWKYGIFLASRKVDQHLCKLFAIDEFYVEILHDQKHQVVGDISAFESIDFLDLYLDTISLSELMVGVQ